MNWKSAFAATGLGSVAVLAFVLALLMHDAEAQGGAASLAAGGGHSCAVTSSGGVKCWGANGRGQLGNGANADEPLPADAVTCDALPTPNGGAGAECGPLADIDSVSAGFTHTCVRHGSGIGLCWGKNTYGQLGDGGTTDQNKAVLVCGGAVGAGMAGIADACCAAAPIPTITATLTVTGTPTSTPTATLTPTPTTTPQPCNSLFGVAAIRAGTNHTCALLEDSTVWCWGDNHYGQLGDGTELNSALPVHVCAATGGAGVPCAPLTDVAAIEAGGHHNCALMDDSTVRCWGNNSSGQLGDGTNGDRLIPTVVCQGMAATGVAGGGGTCSQLSGVSSVTTGGSHTCAVKSDGSLFCWGENSSGQVGDGTSFDRSAPVAVCQVPPEASAAGGADCCTSTVGGGTPGIEPCTIQDAASTSAGGEHTCAVVEKDAELVCWGSNNSGQLGHGSVIDTPLPATVCEPNSAVAGSMGCSPFANVAAVYSGYEHTCALTGTGGVFCWGENSDGKLGDGTTVERTRPAEVSGFLGKPTPTRTATRTQTPSATPAVTATTTSTATSQATPSYTPSNTPTRTRTPSPIPNNTNTPTRTPVTPSGANGDVDCDERVTALDAALILQLIAALIDSVPCPDSVDVNHDGGIDPVDAALVLQFVAGLIPSL